MTIDRVFHINLIWFTIWRIYIQQSFFSRPSIANNRTSTKPRVGKQAHSKHEALHACLYNIYCGWCDFLALPMRIGNPDNRSSLVHAVIARARAKTKLIVAIQPAARPFERASVGTPRLFVHSLCFYFFGSRVSQGVAMPMSFCYRVVLWDDYFFVSEFLAGKTLFCINLYRFLHPSNHDWYD